MFDYMNPTRFDRTDAELLEFWLFAGFAAGKNSTVAAKKLDAFLKLVPLSEFAEASPARLRKAAEDTVLWFIDQRFVGFFRDTQALLASHTLRDADVSVLLDVHGASMKSARFFALHSRQGARLLAFDRHIRTRLIAAWKGQPRLQLLKPTKAKWSPSVRQYERIEAAFLEWADEQGITDLAAWDIDTWQEVSGRAAA